MSETEAEWGVERTDDGDIVITIADDNDHVDIYTMEPLRGTGGISLVQAACAMHFMQAFEAAQAGWAEKVRTDPTLEHGDSWYLYSMVLGVDGTPASIVMNVDDIPQTFDFGMPEKAEADR